MNHGKTPCSRTENTVYSRTMQLLPKAMLSQSKSGSTISSGRGPASSLAKVTLTYLMVSTRLMSLWGHAMIATLSQHLQVWLSAHMVAWLNRVKRMTTKKVSEWETTSSSKMSTRLDAMQSSSLLTVSPEPLLSMITSHLSKLRLELKLLPLRSVSPAKMSCGCRS